jgi:hypothetical protein
MAQIEPLELVFRERMKKIRKKFEFRIIKNLLAARIFEKCTAFRGGEGGSITVIF